MIYIAITRKGDDKPVDNRVLDQELCKFLEGSRDDCQQFIESRNTGILEPLALGLTWDKIREGMQKEVWRLKAKGKKKAYMFGFVMVRILDFMQKNYDYIIKTE